MNVTVFGATGAIGALTVDELLERGHAVTAYIRNPAKVPDRWAGAVSVVVGQIEDATAIDTVVAGSDVVVSALGPSMDRHATGLPLVEGTGHILAAMRRHGVTRYIGHGTPSILDPRERPTLQTRLIRFLGRTFLPRAYAELIGMTDLVMQARVRWTIVRFTAPKDTPKRDALRVGSYGQNSIGFAISRADIAAFTASQVVDDTYLDAAPAISN
ncbi:NAD(P)-dependent oxidoreductase [Agromyces sp. GXS1127]|uniref:NAD(P)-dependent oxidoreductase n=1 Tax=Agromyces sp. GXS1127 TaxID=3424181 RepID=UPI003D311A16